MMADDLIRPPSSSQPTLLHVVTAKTHVTRHYCCISLRNHPLGVPAPPRNDSNHTFKDFTRCLAREVTVELGLLWWSTIEQPPTPHSS